MVIMNDMIKNLAINKSYKNEPKIHSRTERRDIGNKKITRWAGLSSIMEMV